MRVNPPLAIVLLLIVTIAVLSAMKDNTPKQITDCAYTPDGKLRLDARDEWYIDPGYDQLRPWGARPPCDVWKGIEPEKPIGTIRVTGQTDAYGHVAAQISPNGNGFVAVHSPIMDEGEYTGPENKFGGPEDYSDDVAIFEIRDRHDLYSEVSARLAPLRDFLGNHGLGTDDDDIKDPVLREQLGLDDPRTKRLKCRRENTVSHAAITFILFGSDRDGDDPRLFIDWRCKDIAHYGVRHREKNAYDWLVSAAGATDYIKNETREKYPECRISFACREPF